jgi:hypothetical protein
MIGRNPSCPLWGIHPMRNDILPALGEPAKLITNMKVSGRPLV